MIEEICENNNTHKPLVSGPNPLVATNVALLSQDIEELPLRQLLE